MLIANSRAQFTAEDFQFIVRSLARSPEDSVPLADLLSDEDSRDAILDHDLIYQEVVDDCSCLKVSPYFYFYVLTRRMLKRFDIDDRELTDYLASLLATFGLKVSEQHSAGNTPYLSDMLIALSKANSDEGFLIRAQIANVSLFVSGVFADRVNARRDRKGGPDLSFYEQIGQSNYYIASQHRLAAESDLKGVYKRLSRNFHDVRCALNELSETHLHFSHDEHLIIGPMDDDIIC